MDNSQCTLINKINEYQFICVDLNLYIDTNPADEKARADYLYYSKLLKDSITLYESLYGPLMNFGHSPTDVGCYVTSEWPWE